MRIPIHVITLIVALALALNAVPADAVRAAPSREAPVPPPPPPPPPAEAARARTEASLAKALAKGKLTVLEPKIAAAGASGPGVVKIMFDRFAGLVLVIDSKKRVWQVERAPRKKAIRVKHDECQTAPPTEPSPPSPTDVTIELPPGATFAGKKKVVYDGYVVVDVWAKKGPDGKPCPKL
jgi:hypothetical protein